MDRNNLVLIESSFSSGVKAALESLVTFIILLPAIAFIAVLALAAIVIIATVFIIIGIGVGIAYILSIPMKIIDYINTWVTKKRHNKNNIHNNKMTYEEFKENSKISYNEFKEKYFGKHIPEDKK